MGNYKTDDNTKQDRPMAVGIQQDVEASDYHRSIGITKTGLMMLRKSPAHYWNWLNSESEPSTQAMNLGTATHTLLFEPHRWAKDIIVIPDDAPKKATKAQREAKSPSAEAVASMEWWDNFEKQCEKKCVIDQYQFEQAKGMVNAVLSCEDILPLLKHPSAKTELSISAIEKVDGIDIKCKMRCDMLTEDGKTMIDLKTCVDSSYDEFSRTFMSQGYWMQAAHYIETARLAGIPVERFIFIAVEKERPHCVSLYQLADDSLRRAYAIRQRLLKVLAHCSATGKYPASNGVSDLTMPFYIN